MKVIFLDFDGVLNHHGWYAAFRDQHGRSPEFGDGVDHEHLDPACVDETADRAIAMLRGDAVKVAA